MLKQLGVYLQALYLKTKFKAKTTEEVDCAVDFFTDNEVKVEDKKTVIDDYELAEERFTPAYLYALNKCRLEAINDPSSVTTREYWQRHIQARNEFVNENDEVKDLWQMRSRQHIHRQPHIAELIISALEKNPRRSWMGLESDIDNWCGATTIRKWLTTTESFSYYAERILPNLLSHQKVRHKEFAERI